MHVVVHSMELTFKMKDQLARIGKLAIKAHKKRKHADEITERSELEGWHNDPTGSMHVSEAWTQSDKAAAELAEAIDALPGTNLNNLQSFP